MVELLTKSDAAVASRLYAIEDFVEANASFTTGAKLDAVRRASQIFHDRFRSGTQALAVRTFDLITFPYPTRFGLGGAATSPAPYVMMTNRTLLVQFKRDGEVKNLLMNPSDYTVRKTAPYFERQRERYGNFVSNRLLTKRYREVPEYLKEVGIDPKQIDYVSFDHLHVQDLRALMGTTTGIEPLYPNAHFIFHQAEVESMKNLHPLQILWYVPDALKDVRTDKQILIDGDVMLGDGVAILHTPGHTAGNISLAVNTPDGVFVTSENGVSIDNYHPLESRIPGVRQYAREWGYEVILNSNTLEYTADQYTSMMKEKIVAGNGAVAPGVPNFFPSSELTPSWLAPGLAPTFERKKISFGELKNM